MPSIDQEYVSVEIFYTGRGFDEYELSQIDKVLDDIDDNKLEIPKNLS